MGPATSGGIMVTAGMAAEDIRSFKSMMGSEEKERDCRVGGVEGMLRERDCGGWYGEDVKHILTATYRWKRDPLKILKIKLRIQI